jgi:organic hydroperoxide reductase OsmC/OhrA
MDKQHQYSLNLTWTGNTGQGTATYRGYDRGYKISIENKPDLAGSADPHFRGDKTRYNPEDLLVAALSSCHLLSYLHLCAEAGIVVTAYEDHATGTMKEDAETGGFFTEVTLHPVVTITDSLKKAHAIELHERANKLCFIANSCNFPIRHEVTIQVK